MTLGPNADWNSVLLLETGPLSQGDFCVPRAVSIARTCEASRVFAHAAYLIAPPSSGCRRPGDPTSNRDHRSQARASSLASNNVGLNEGVTDGSRPADQEIVVIPKPAQPQACFSKPAKARRSTSFREVLLRFGDRPGPHTRRPQCEPPKWPREQRPVLVDILDRQTLEVRIGHGCNPG